MAGRGISIERLDGNIAEHHGVVVAGETEMTARAILPGMPLVIQKSGHGAKIGVENRRAVQLHLDDWPDDGDLLVIPFANRMLVAALRRAHAVSRTMGLARINLRAGGLFVMIVEHLALAHPDISRVATAWIANRQSVVAAGWQFECQADGEIGVFRFGVNRAA